MLSCHGLLFALKSLIIVSDLLTASFAAPIAVAPPSATPSVAFVAFAALASPTVISPFTPCVALVASIANHVISKVITVLLAWAERCGILGIEKIARPPHLGCLTRYKFNSLSLGRVMSNGRSQNLHQTRQNDRDSHRAAPNGACSTVSMPAPAAPVRIAREAHEIGLARLHPS